MELKRFALVAGIVFLLLGVIGFFSDNLFGMLHLGTVHNVIHLAVGVAGIAASFQLNYSLLFAKVLGVLYVLLGALGFFTPELFGMMHVDVSDNVLHLLVGFIALYLGYVMIEQTSQTKTTKSESIS